MLQCVVTLMFWGDGRVNANVGNSLTIDLNLVDIGNIIDQLWKSCFRVVIEP